MSDCHTTGPCEACLDWRTEQTADVGGHIADVVRAILLDLDLDPRDEHVRTVVAKRLRAADPTHDDT